MAGLASSTERLRTGEGTTLSARQIRLGLVLFGTGGPGRQYMWLDPEIPVDASVNIDWFIEQARLAEAAKFDLIFIVDSQFITANSPPHYLNRLEPLTLLSALAVATTHIGLVGTLTTSFNEPFNVARRLASLDLISHGRAGWNVVTSGDAGAAGNFGLDEHYDYDTRYGRGLEFVKVVQGLWDSYEDDAFVRDRSTRTFLDATRQHALNHRGQYFSVVGPLNIVRSKQGQPVIFQAGNSEQGRDLGGAIGEGIFTHAPTIGAGQDFYRDIKARAVASGRNPDEVVVLPGISPVVGDTDAEAREIERELQLADQDFDSALAEFGRPFGWHDFRQYDLDAAFPEEALRYAENSFKTNAESIVTLAKSNNFTLRETILHRITPKPGPFVGAPETVANTMQEWFEARALDGYNITVGHPAQLRRFIDDVLPILRERGVLRREYESDTLRGNLGLPFPENRHAVARRGPQVDRETSPALEGAAAHAN
jgi:FMN-dependent oxidoreductase (nitrilotriacetate monooxygenase family)